MTLNRSLFALVINGGDERAWIAGGLVAFVAAHIP